MRENYSLNPSTKEQFESFIKAKKSWSKPNITDLNIIQTLGGNSPNYTENTIADSGHPS